MIYRRDEMDTIDEMVMRDLDNGAFDNIDYVVKKETLNVKALVCAILTAIAIFGVCVIIIIFAPVLLFILPLFGLLVLGLYEMFNDKDKEW